MSVPGPLLISMCLAFGLSAGLTLAMRRIAPRLGAVATPKADRWNRRTVPLLGGVGIWAGTILPALFIIPATRGTPPMIYTGTAAFLLGLADDFIPLKPSTKLTGQIAIGCYAVFAGIAGDWTGSPVIDALLSVFWIVAVSNAFNLLDNMDGLCAGIGTIAALALVLIVRDLSSGVFLISALLAASTAAFLLFNFSPASIFMGDGGSLFIGATLAMLSLGGEPRTRTGLVATVAVPALLLLVPIFDTAFVTISRKLSRRPASRGGRDHTSHRLVALGFSEAQSVLLLYALAGVAAATAVAIARRSVPESRLVLLVLLVALSLLGVQLARVRVYGEDDFAALRSSRYTPLLITVTYKRRIFEVLLDCVLIAAAYYAAYILRFDRDFPEYYDYFARSLPIVLACQLVSFFVAGVYRGVWRFFGISDLLTHVKGIAFGVVSSVIALVYLFRFEGYSRVVFFIDGMALLILMLGSRASFRVMSDLATRQRSSGRRALVYGAGEGGAMLVRELRNNVAYAIDPIGFLDDDSARHGRKVSGLPVHGGIEQLTALIAGQNAEVVILSTRKLQPERLAKLATICHDSGTELLHFVFSLEPLGHVPSKGVSPSGAPHD